MMKEVIDLIERKIIIFRETLRKYEILQKGMIEDNGSENSSLKIMILDYKERIETYENAIKILSNERETVRKHESKKEFVDEQIKLDHDFQSTLNNMKCNRKPTNERF